MKIKNIILTALSLALVAAVSIGGTLAYLTDRDSKVNTFTVGDVKVGLTENFKADAELLPGAKIEKEAFITNTGENDAWVWMTMAIPAALDDNDLTTVGENNYLHWNVPGAVWNGYHSKSNATKIATAKENGWITDEHIDAETGLVKDECTWIICQTEDAPVQIQQKTIDGVVYNVYTFLYNGKLAAGAKTPVALHQVYLDDSVDINTDGKWYSVANGEATAINWNSNTNGTPKVIVSAYAIQAEGFDSVEKAYDAYQKQWADNGTEYGQ